MKKTLIIAAALSAISLACTGALAFDLGDSATAETPAATPAPAAAPAALPAGVAARTHSEMIIEKLTSGENNAVGVTYQVNMALTAEVMQALKATGDKSIVISERKGKEMVWQIVLRADQVTEEPAIAFVPNTEISQNSKDGSITVSIGKEGYKLGCNTLIRVPADNGALGKDVALKDELLEVYKLNDDTNKWEKTKITASINESGCVYFFTASAGKFLIKNRY